MDRDGFDSLCRYVEVAFSLHDSGENMARSVQQVIIGGKELWVEVEDIPVQAKPGKFRPTSAGGNAAKAAVEKIRQADVAETVGAIFESIQAGLAKVRPEEFSIELSLGLKADVGVFVASSEASAQVKVTAKWKPGALPTVMPPKSS